MTQRYRIILLGICLVCMCILALTQGSVSWSQLWHNVDGSELSASSVLFSIRLPRIINAVFVGMALASAGCLAQALLRNPLAEPYVLGISGGTATLMLLATLLGVSSLWLPLWGITGASLALGVILALSRQQHSQNNLLLGGVLMAIAWSAVIQLLLTLSQSYETRGMVYWLIGDLSSLQIVWPAYIMIIAGMALAIRLSPWLDTLTLGEHQAIMLGCHIQDIRKKLLLAIALLSTGAVLLAGSIGFIGLIIPHIARIVVGYQHRYTVPAAGLLGAIFLVAADTAARTLWSPTEIPVGIITALLGIPAFFIFLRKEVRV